MDINQWKVRTGIGSSTQKFVGGKKETLHFKLRAPDEWAFHLGEIAATSETGEGAVNRQQLMAKFIAESLCHEDGTLLTDIDTVSMFAPSLKQQLCQIIIAASSESVATLGKG